MFGLYRALPINANLLYLLFSIINITGIFLFGKFFIFNRTNHRIVFSLFSLLLLMIFSLIFLESRQIGIKYLFSHIYCFTFYLVTINSLRVFLTPAFIQTAYKMLLMSILIVSILMSLEGFFYYNFGQFNIASGARADGFFGNPNHASLILSLSYAMITQIEQSNLIKRIRFSRFLPLIVFIAIAASFSKGSMIGFIILFIYFALYDNKSFPIYLIPIFSLFFIFFDGIIYYLEFNELVHRNSLSRVFSQSTFFDSLDSRLQVIPYALNEFSKNPLFGNGVGYNFIWSFDYASHNIFLLYMVDLGIIGLMIISYFIYQIYKIYPPFFLLFLVGCFFNHNILSVVEFYVLVAILTIVKDLKTELDYSKINKAIL